MSSLATYDAFETKLRTEWTATDIVFENERYRFADTPVPFVYVEIVGDTFPQETIGAPGNNLFRETGMAYLHVMVPDDSGTRVAREYADALTRLFREKDTAGVKIDDMAIGSGSPGRDFPNYWAMTVTLWCGRYEFTQP
jgi:hypothetical protein